MRNICALIILLTLPILLFAFIYVSAQEASQEASTGEAVCGDGIISGNEQCDGTNLDGQTCQSLGYYGGTLSCKADCTFNTSGCTTAPPPTPPPPRPGVGIIPRIFPPLEPLFPPKPPLPTGDFNGDGLINFRDLSILLYWFGKTGPEIIPYDLNQDGKINYVDVSILLYRWRE